MEGFSLLGDEDDIVAAGGLNIRDHIIESATEEIARYGGLGVFPGEDNPEPIETLAVGENIRDESIRKKRFS